MRVATIDIGTLTCRLLIGEVVGPGPVKPLYSGRKILRLGEGVDHTKRLRPEAMTRVVEAIREWQGIIDQHEVHASAAVQYVKPITATNSFSGSKRKLKSRST